MKLYRPNPDTLVAFESRITESFISFLLLNIAHSKKFDGKEQAKGCSSKIPVDSVAQWNFILKISRSSADLPISRTRKPNLAGTFPSPRSRPKKIGRNVSKLQKYGTQSTDRLSH